MRAEACRQRLIALIFVSKETYCVPKETYYFGTCAQRLANIRACTHTYAHKRAQHTHSGVEPSARHLLRTRHFSRFLSLSLSLSLSPFLTSVPVP